MTKTTLLSLVVATVLFTACGEDKKAIEEAAKAKAERTVELEKMAADKIIAKAAEKAEVVQIRLAEKAVAKAKAEKERIEKEKIKKEAAEAAKKEAEVVAEEAAAKALAEKDVNTTEALVTDAAIIEAVANEVKITH